MQKSSACEELLATWNSDTNLHHHMVVSIIIIVDSTPSAVHAVHGHSPETYAISQQRFFLYIKSSSGSNVSLSTHPNLAISEHCEIQLPNVLTIARRTFLLTRFSPPLMFPT